MPAVPRLPIVGVIGSHSDGPADRAAAVGRMLAGLPVHLLTGAGPGVMRAASRAFHEVPHRKGLVLGIVPCASDSARGTPKPGYPNDWVEVPIRTHLHLSGPQGEHELSRNQIVALTADAIVALPGGEGTASEVRLALRYRRPLIAFLRSPEEIPGLPAGVPVEPDLERVRAFVTEALATFR